MGLLGTSCWSATHDSLYTCCMYQNDISTISFRSYSCWCHNLPENAESTRINSNASSTGNVMINIDKPCDSVFPQIFRYQSHVLRGTNPHPDSARRSLLLSPCELRLRLKETSLRETPNLSPNKSSLGRPNMLWPCRCIYYNIDIYIYYTIYIYIILYIQNIWKPIYMILTYINVD